MKRNIRIIASTFLIIGSVIISTIPVMASESSIGTIEPYGDVLVWKKKIMNGRLYKRLWNETKNRWETDWILV